jgi:hypothetical protein
VAQKHRHPELAKDLRFFSSSFARAIDSVNAFRFDAYEKRQKSEVLRKLKMTFFGNRADRAIRRARPVIRAPFTAAPAAR